jgi:hypothetical protein
LQNRVLTSWSDRSRHIWERTATQNMVLSTINLLLSTPLSALYQYVDMATEPLYQIFDGFELSTDVIEELTNKKLGRKR